MKESKLSMRSPRSFAAAFVVCTVLAAPSVQAGVFVPATFIEFDTALTSLNLTGGPFLMPLASDPGNALGDSISGYGFVESLVSISLSSQRSVSPGPASIGKACAFQGGTPQTASTQAAQGCGDFGTPPPINPAELDGKSFLVNSFFDVFFDITVKDVDARPGRDLAGMPDGAMITIPDNGPASMQSFYSAIFNMNAPNYGLVPPPEVSPYIGHFDIEIPLGGDINGNGENDKIKFTLAAHAVGDQNRTFVTLPDGTVIDSFETAASLAGAVVDVSTDPPFTIGNTDLDACLPLATAPTGCFSGPTTGISKLLNPLEQVPEPATLALLGLGLAGLGFSRRKRAR